MLAAQLEECGNITQRRIRVWEEYHTCLEPLEQRGRLRRPVVPASCRHNAHIYYVLLPRKESFEQVQRSLEMHGIQAYGHYAALHTTPGGQRFGRPHPRGCEVSASVAQRLLRLPLWPTMTTEQVHLVVETLAVALGDLPGTVYATPT